MQHDLEAPFQKDVVGYCDPLSVLPGEQVSFKLSAYGGEGSASADIVHLISGDDRPHGTGLIANLVESLKSIPVTYQPLVNGSYGIVEDVPGHNADEISVWFYPTLVNTDRQTLFRWQDLEVSISDVGLFAKWADDEIHLQLALQDQRWYELNLTLGPEPILRVRSKPLGPGEQAVTLEQTSITPLRISGGELVLAAAKPGLAHFNGRLEAIRISGSDKDSLHLDFSCEISSQKILDVSGNERHGTLYQNPIRGVCGVQWDGSVQSYHDKPNQYGAIHFHEDDLTDAGWKDSLSWTVPEDLASGQYALKVSLRESVDFVPFFVRAPREKRKPLAYLVPTASYLAYANQRLSTSDSPFGSPKLHHANDAFLRAHEEIGLSMYEHHRDHSGVHFSSRLRPVLNMKPQTGTWAFNADTHLTAWLDAIDQEFDVLTDEDLHRDGVEALEGYQCVVTGTHPEYYSTSMRDALEAWLSGNGRLMYMGGNGFYWRVAFQEDNLAVMEVRRAEGGTRAWMAEPGEYYHQFGGEYGGMWRRVGKPPNQLVGIGFTAQGFDGGTYYRVQPGALDPRVAFIVDGVSDLGERDTWGSFGNQGGGAAGEEIDRFDLTLGSPAHAVVIASSENHKKGMLRVTEEVHMSEPVGDDPKVRADMTFFEVGGGGAVFSTGSISYAGSLAHNDYQNEIALITANVLRRFIDPKPFDFPED
ncbi:MAG: hypothetical protein GKR90_07835 [Pseudomonadales bacterium]|nr:hypothetical protein [Pseudomonadales bacterium]